MNSRRNFIKATTLGVAGVSLKTNVVASTFFTESNQWGIHIFSKCLQFLDYNKMAEVVAQAGFDGADLTVRRGGQVLPENVKTDLPKVVKALRENGVDSKMIVTDITDPDDPMAADILQTMANLGIKYYRLGYLDYDTTKSIPENLDIHKHTFENLEKLNQKYGVHGGYQNHSGTRVGGPAWDLYYLLKDRNPEFIGVQYDVRHAMVEGGISWPLGMKLLAPWIKTTDIKDFIWQKTDNGDWEIKNVPLGEGMVDFEKYFGLYKSLNIAAPVSIHYEYDLGGAEHGSTNPTMSLEEISGWLLKDILFLKSQFRSTGLH